MILTFEEFRKIKDSLPDGSMKKIADRMEMDVETVRNYFGGANYKPGQVPGIHNEKGTTVAGYELKMKHFWIVHSGF